MASTRMEGDNPEDCPVCLLGFDDLVQRPRTLPCGHTACTLCIDKLKQQGSVTCPECCVSHAVPVGGEFPVCYTIEAFIRRMRDGKVAAASPPPNTKKGKGTEGAPEKKEVADVPKRMRYFLEEQEATVVAAITACQKAQSQLDQYEATLTGWGERQQQVEDSLQGLVDQSRSARDLVQQEKLRVAAKKEEAKKMEQELQALRETLRTPATKQEACLAVAEVLHCTSEAEQVLEECQQCFPDAGTLTTARKVREASSAALEAAQDVQATADVSTEEYSSQSDPNESMPQSDPEEPSSQSKPDLTTMEKAQSILKLSLKEPLQAEDLLSLTQRARSLVQAGQVFAMHQVEGQSRHARISLDPGRPCLHALEEQHPPRGVAILQISQIVPPSPPCTVFLDLSWSGRTPRRVYIRLSPDTPRGKSFILACTGQLGPCYRGSRLFGVEWKGRPGESVRGGDYESNDGTGQCELLLGLGEGEYQESGRAGAVWGWWGKGLFAIATRDRRDGRMFPDVFGEVVKGLHVVADAAQHSNIKEVTVVDCGVVL